MKSYDHKKIEKKWQKKWEEEQAHAASDTSENPKLYILDMFPYPSGAGLHVGHVEGYTATDILSRFRRAQGYNVLHPMGWDAFGLPAENYAVKTGIPPVKTTADAIEAFKRQIKSLGLSYDWSREIGTHTPEYYKWTQWFFLTLYKNGLAYKKKAKVNWDPVDQTVLANEQVLPDGTAERSGAKVIQKDLEQWFFKITDFADALVDDLDQVDWPESTKTNQRNWIGRSEGAEVDFKIDGSDEKITVFTTRPDTLFGATYLVLAPEHPWIGKTTFKNNDEVAAYVETAKNKTDLDRQADVKEKTGVELEGVKAINPATGEQIPLYVADYVLGGYGTGAIMAVPAHDERDYDFADKFGIPIREVVMPVLLDSENPPRPGKENTERDIILAIVRDPKSGNYLTLRWKEQPWTTFVTGGIEDGEDPIEAAKREIAEETGYTRVRLVRDLGSTCALFYAAHKDLNRKAHARSFLFELETDEKGDVSEQEKAQHEVAWLSEREARAAGMRHAEIDILWRRIETGKNIYAGPGALINSGEFSGVQSDEAKKKLTEAFGRAKKTYKLRDWLISRQRYWGAPIPIVYDPEGNAHPIPEEHLPWLLPTDVEFKPTGVSPLGQSKELKERTEKIFGAGWRPEIDTMDTFVCSSWYYFRFADPHDAEAFASKQMIEKWLPVDLYMGGAEHTVLHLMYARFFTKVLQKLGHVTFTEPFLKLRHQGTILAEDGTKMSKSKGNVVNPDDCAATYGADAVRMYEMFMGPLESMKPWSTTNIIGIRRFLERVNGLTPDANATLPEALDIALNQTIKKVTEDLDGLKMNTAVSALMILLNEFEKLDAVPLPAYKIFLQLLAPFAPHLTHELWEQAGETAEVRLAPWPVADEAKLKGKTMLIVVQINGKVRGEVRVETDAEKSAIEQKAREAVVARLEGKSILKTIVVPNRLVNFVVSE